MTEKMLTGTLSLNTNKQIMENENRLALDTNQLKVKFYLSHSCVKANSADSDQNAASDQGLHCLHTGISIKNEIKMKTYTRHGNGSFRPLSRSP